MSSKRIREKLWIDPLFFPLFLWMCFRQGAGAAGAFVFSFLLHEGAHILLARAFGLELQCLEIYPFGCAARLPGLIFCNNYAELLVAAAGPAVNIVAAAVILIWGEGHAFLSALCKANIAMAAVNLLPILPLDGGRIFCAAVSIVLNERRAIRLSVWIGVLAAIGFVGTGIYMWACGHENLSLLSMGVMLLIASCKTQRLQAEKRGHILLNRSKIGEYGPVPVRMVALPRSESVGKALMQMHQRAYNMVCILDESGRACGMVDEVTLSEYAIRCGTDRKLYMLSEKGLTTGVDRMQDRCYNKKQCFLQQK